MKNKSKYQEITNARKILGLSESATRLEIKQNYRNLLVKWHPDHCGHDKERCIEMTEKIINAYKTISLYCEEYRYSFSREEVDKYISVDEWWRKRFAQDPLWAK